MAEDTKRCSKCGEIKALSEFSKNSTAKDGLNVWCRACYSEYSAKRYIENAAEEKARTAKWRAEHPGQNGAASLAWSKTHPENRRANKHRRRALKATALGDHNADDISMLYKAQGGRCAYCDALVGKKYDIDHIVPLSRGGSNAPDNLALACGRCNRSKGDRLLSEWTTRPSRALA